MASENIEQVVYAVDAARKRHLLVHLLQARSIAQVIVICRTRQGAEQLTRELKRDGLAAEAIHGDKAQSQRLETLSAFKDGQVRVLVATDVAARGLDIEELPFVVNFELPNSPPMGRDTRSPRSAGMMQNVQRWLQPSLIFR